MTEIPLEFPPGFADEWLARLRADQEYRDAWELDNGLLSPVRILEVFEEAIAAFHAGVPVETSNRWVNRALGHLPDDERQALATWHGHPQTPRMRDRFVGRILLLAHFVGPSPKLEGDEYLRGPGARCKDIHPEGLGLGGAWLLAEGTAAQRAADPMVVAAHERVAARCG